MSVIPGGNISFIYDLKCKFPKSCLKSHFLDPLKLYLAVALICSMYYSHCNVWHCMYCPVSVRLWWTLWWGPSHPSWTCCWCVWSSGSSSVLWGWTCLLESTTTALMRRQRNISRPQTSTTRRNVLHSSIPITVRFAGKTSRSTLITWALDIWHSYKWCVYFIILFKCH